MNSNPNESFCKLTRYGITDRQEFGLISCMQCYNYLVYVFHDFVPQFNVSDHVFLTNDPIQPVLSPKIDKDVELVGKTMDKLKFKKWRECCDQADMCCDAMVKGNVYPSRSEVVSDPSKCRSIWDGWSCHLTTKSGQASLVKCPAHHVPDTCHTILGELFARF